MFWREHPAVKAKVLVILALILPVTEIDFEEDKYVPPSYQSESLPPPPPDPVSTVMSKVDESPFVKVIVLLETEAVVKRSRSYTESPL